MTMHRFTVSLAVLTILATGLCAGFIYCQCACHQPVIDEAVLIDGPGPIATPYDADKGIDRMLNGGIIDQDKFDQRKPDMRDGKYVPFGDVMKK